MASKLLLGVIAMVAVVAVGGIGFASYTSSVTLYGGASSGDVSLAFDYASATPGTYAVCNVYYLSGDVAEFSATDLSPGDQCSVTLGVINNGTLPATSESSTFYYESGALCESPSQTNCVGVSDNLNIVNLNTIYGNNGAGDYGIAADGGLFPGNYQVTVWEPSGSTGAVSLTFYIVFTGSVGT